MLTISRISKPRFNVDLLSLILRWQEPTHTRIAHVFGLLLVRGLLPLINSQIAESAWSPASYPYTDNSVTGSPYRLVLRIKGFPESSRLMALSHAF
jgi:hypothetical protein